MMKIFPAVFTAAVFFLSPVLFAGGSPDGIPVYEQDDFDVAVEAFPVLVKSLGSGTAVDAVENDPENRMRPQAIVSMRILRVFRGELGNLKISGPSRIEQMREAARERKILKLLTLDFENPEEETEREYLRIAVRNPIETFGIQNWDDPGDERFKLYLKRMPGRRDSYVLVKVKK